MKTVIAALVLAAAPLAHAEGFTPEDLARRSIERRRRGRHLGHAGGQPRPDAPRAAPTPSQQPDRRPRRPAMAAPAGPTPAAEGQFALIIRAYVPGQPIPDDGYAFPDVVRR